MFDTQQRVGQARRQNKFSPGCEVTLAGRLSVNVFFETRLFSRLISLFWFSGGITSDPIMYIYPRNPLSLLRFAHCIVSFALSLNWHASTLCFVHMSSKNHKYVTLPLPTTAFEVSTSKNLANASKVELSWRKKTPKFLTAISTAQNPKPKLKMAAKFQLHEIALIASSFLILCAIAVLCLLRRLHSRKAVKTANRRSRRLRNPSDLEASFHDEILSSPSLTSSSLRYEAVRGPATRPLAVPTIQDEKDIWWPVFSLSSHPAFRDTKRSSSTTDPKNLDIVASPLSMDMDADNISVCASDGFRGTKCSGSATDPKNLNTTPSPPWIAINADDPSDWTTETVTNSIPSRRGSWPLHTSEICTRAADRPQSRRKATKAPKRWLVYEHHSSGSKLFKVIWDDPMERKKAKTASEADSKASSVPFYVASPPHEGVRREIAPSWLGSIF
jgi:hypothetical protein